MEACCEVAVITSPDAKRMIGDPDRNKNVIFVEYLVFKHYLRDIGGNMLLVCGKKECSAPNLG